MKMMGIWKFDCGQVTLKFEPADVRQAHVQHQAGRRLRTLGAEELARRPEGLHAQSHRGDESLDGVADRRIVINHKYDRIGIVHDVAGAA